MALLVALALARAAIRPPAMRVTGTYLKICSFKAWSFDVLSTVFLMLANVRHIHLSMA